MLFSSEADMQSAFTPFLEEGGLSEYPNLACELKHVRCEGKRGCKAGVCTSRLDFQDGGHHEAAQATELLRSLGLSADGRRTAYKLSDEARGKKPYDCFRFAKADGAFFVIGWSCAAVGHCVSYAVDAVAMARFIAGGNRGLRIADCVMLGGFEVEF